MTRKVTKRATEPKAVVEAADPLQLKQGGALATMAQLRRANHVVDLLVSKATLSALMTEAAECGSEHVVDQCARALAGDRSAKLDCARTIGQALVAATEAP